MEEESRLLCVPRQPTLAVISKDVPASVITLAFKRSSSNLSGVLFPAAARWQCLPCWSQTARAAAPRCSVRQQQPAVADGPGHAPAARPPRPLGSWAHGRCPSTESSSQRSVPGERLCGQAFPLDLGTESEAGAEPRASPSPRQVPAPPQPGVSMLQAVGPPPVQAVGVLPAWT